jgi:hypothetical protein
MYTINRTDQLTTQAGYIAALLIIDKLDISAMQ